MLRNIENVLPLSRWAEKGRHTNPFSRSSGEGVNLSLPFVKGEGPARGAPTRTPRKICEHNPQIN